MQILRPYLRPKNQVPLGWCPAICALGSPSGDSVAQSNLRASGLVVFRVAPAPFKRQRAEEAGNGEKDGKGCVHSSRSEQLPWSVNSNKALMKV